MALTIRQPTGHRVIILPPATVRRAADSPGFLKDPAAAAAEVEHEIKRVFEISPHVVTLEVGTLAREFESSVKAPRIRDLRT